MKTSVRKFILIVLMLIAGAAVLAPIVIAFGPERWPGDFVLTWGKENYLVPVFWSLCASGVLGLLYLFYRR
ncbi:MAG TPA: hypothetical protein VJ750_00650 [Rhizomicrobium sp.]|nr:hypothetical protein [Rhizomicrobium sp.]